MATDWESVDEAGEYRKLAPGCYVAKIIKAWDLPHKEYNQFLYDIQEGDSAFYFSDEFYFDKDWTHQFFRSYKQRALSFYKSFFRAVEKSNPGGQFSGDEHDARQFQGKLVGIVLQEEEYESNLGDVRVRLSVAKTIDAAEVRNGSAKPLPRKLLEGSSTQGAPSTDNSALTVSVFDSDDIPF
jgi:hypothetical protein